MTCDLGRWPRLLHFAFGAVEIPAFVAWLKQPKGRPSGLHLTKSAGKPRFRTALNLSDRSFPQPAEHSERILKLTLQLERITVSVPPEITPSPPSYRGKSLKEASWSSSAAWHAK